MFLYKKVTHTGTHTHTLKMILLVFISILQVEGIIRGAIDSGCSFDQPVYGRPVDGNGATGCYARRDLARIRYPDFETSSFWDIQAPKWIKICDVTKSLVWRGNRWVDYGIDKFTIIRHHLRIPVAPGQLLYVQDCLDRHLFYRTYGKEKGTVATTTTTTMTTRTTTTKMALTTTTTTTTTARATTMRVSTQPATPTPTTTATVTGKTTTTTTTTMGATTRPPTTVTEKTTTTTMDATTVTATETRLPTVTGTTAIPITPGTPRQLWVAYIMIPFIFMVLVFIAYKCRCRSISLARPDNSIEMEHLIQLSEDVDEPWVDINRHSIYYRRIITQDPEPIN